MQKHENIHKMNVTLHKIKNIHMNKYGNEETFGKTHYVSLVHLLTYLFSKPSFHPTHHPPFNKHGCARGRAGVINRTETVFALMHGLTF